MLATGSPVSRQQTASQLRQLRLHGHPRPLFFVIVCCCCFLTSSFLVSSAGGHTKTRVSALTSNHQLPRPVGCALLYGKKFGRKISMQTAPVERERRFSPAPLLCRRTYCRVRAGQANKDKNKYVNDHDGQGGGGRKQIRKTTGGPR